METSGAPRRRPGRPLSFDRAAALHEAMLLFWRLGYEGASVSALTAAMGVTPPSLYAAFGDKKALFREAVGLYLVGPADGGEGTSRELATRLLEGAVIRFTGEDTPAGCLLATSALSCSPAAADVQEELAAVRRKVESVLRDAVLRDVRAGELADGVDAEALAGHVMAVVQGLSTLARDGAPRDRLQRIAALALAAWPPRPSAAAR